MSPATPPSHRDPAAATALARVRGRAPEIRANVRRLAAFANVHACPARQACIVVGRDTDRALLEGIPPATPGYLGWDPDPALDGWDAHEGVFRLLEPHVIRA